MNSATCDIAVIGCGPAGIMAALAAAGNGKKVVILERMPQPAGKLLASGGGRCNLTNTLRQDEFMAQFGRNGRFMDPALSVMGQNQLREFLGKLGVYTNVQARGRIFPVSNNARDIVDALLRRAGELGVRIISSSQASGIEVNGSMVSAVSSNAGSIKPGAVILASGGVGYSRLGGSRSGMEIARTLGHRIVEPAPSLVPLVTAEQWVTHLAGVSVDPVVITTSISRKSTADSDGAMLFTHRGISGPAVLDISGPVSGLLKEHGTAVVNVNLVPRFDSADWSRGFDRWQRNEGTTMIERLLARHIPLALASQVCTMAGLPPRQVAATFSATARKSVIQNVTALPLTVTGTEGFEQAMVTRGGVSLKDVNPATLESRVIKRLYFAGELLDLDGPTGGFNLQWAFASGWLAGLNASI